MYVIATLRNADGTYDEVGMNNRRPFSHFTGEALAVHYISNIPMFNGKVFRLEFFKNPADRTPYKVTTHNESLQDIVEIRNKAMQSKGYHYRTDFENGKFESLYTKTFQEAMNLFSSMDCKGTIQPLRAKEGLTDFTVILEIYPSYEKLKTDRLRVFANEYVMNTYFKKYRPFCSNDLVIRVNETGGWFVDFFVNFGSDGITFELLTINTANDQAVYNSAITRLREKSYFYNEYMTPIREDRQ